MKMKTKTGWYNALLHRKKQTRKQAIGDLESQKKSLGVHVEKKKMDSNECLNHSRGMILPFLLDYL